ncbi:MAG: hypothetical protein ACK5MW_04590 [Enterococcus sp.]
MNLSKEWTYFTNGVALGATLGVITGTAATLYCKKKQHLSADRVLDLVKLDFLKEGAIEGSWINFEKQPIRKFAVHTQAYSGGITRMEDDQLVSYEFLADTKTGTVLDISREVLEN